MWIGFQRFFLNHNKWWRKHLSAAGPMCTPCFTSNRRKVANMLGLLAGLNVHDVSAVRPK